MISTRAWWRVILWMMMSLILLHSFGPALGRIEGKFWPVVRAAQITSVTDDGLTSVFEGTTDKIRDCDFISIRWFVGQHDGAARSDAQLLILERDKLRPISPFGFGPWAVRLSEADLRGNSFAEVQHDCHMLFPTVTRFYP